MDHFLLSFYRRAGSDSSIPRLPWRQLLWSKSRHDFNQPRFEQSRPGDHISSDNLSSLGSKYIRPPHPFWGGLSQKKLFDD
jgi:hypothetical protein